MFRWRWDHVEAKLIDKRFIKREWMNAQRTVAYQEWEYMVEVREGVKPLKLLIRERTYNLTNVDVGDTVPVLVNRRRTKAAFDLDDPRVGFAAAEKRKEAARKQRQAEDEARFAKKLSE